MKITIHPEENTRDILTIMIDEEPWRRVHRGIFGRFPKFTSTTTSDLEEEFSRKERRLAKGFTIKRLMVKNYHSQELSNLLKERLINQTLINEIIAEYEEFGYIDDQDWIDGMLRREMSHQAGPKQVIWKIRNKGVKEDDLEEKIREQYPLETQVEQITTLIAKKYHKKNLEDYKDRQKVIAAMARRGFDFEAIQQALSAQGIDV